MSVVWKPLPSADDVARRIDALAQLCPPLLRLSEGKDSGGWADGRSTVVYLLSALCTQYVRRLDFSPGAGRPDPVVEAFFSGGKLDTEAIAYRSTPRAVAAWLAVLDQRKNAYRYRFDLKAVAGGADKAELRYRLSVKLAPAATNEEHAAPVWTSLHKAAALPGAADALSFAVMLGSYLPELALLQTAPAADLGGGTAALLPPRSVDGAQPARGRRETPQGTVARAHKPKLTVAAKTKGSKNLEASFGLEKILDYEWTVAVGDETFSLKDFEALVKKGRRLVRLKDGFLTIDPDAMRRLLERAARDPTAMDAVAAFFGRRGSVQSRSQKNLRIPLPRKRRRPAPRAPRRAPPLSDRRLPLGLEQSFQRIRLPAGRRHGSGKNGAGHRARAQAERGRQAGGRRAGRRAGLAHDQLAAGAGALRAEPQRPRLLRTPEDPQNRGRCPAEHLRDRPARHRKKSQAAFSPSSSSTKRTG